MWYSRPKGRLRRTDESCRMSQSLPSLPNYASEKSQAEPIAFLQQTAAQLVRSLQEAVAHEDAEVLRLRAELRRSKVQTHEFVLSQHIVVGPVVADKEKLVSKRVRFSVRQIRALELAETARAQLSVFKEMASHEQSVVEDAHELEHAALWHAHVEQKRQMADERREWLGMLEEDTWSMCVRAAEREQAVERDFEQTAEDYQRRIEAQDRSTMCLVNRTVALRWDVQATRSLGSGKRTQILQAWKRFRCEYVVFFHRRARDQAAGRIRALEEELVRRRDDPDLAGKAPAERTRELRVVETDLHASIHQSRCNAVTRSFLNNAMAIEGLREYEAGLQAEIAELVRELQVALEEKKCVYADFILEKEPQGAARAKKILDESEAELDAIQQRITLSDEVTADAEKDARDAQEAMVRMKRERDLLATRLETLQRKSAQQWEVLETRQSAIGYAKLNEQLHEGRNRCEYVAVMKDAPALAEVGYYVGNELGPERAAALARERAEQAAEEARLAEDEAYFAGEG